MSEREEKFERMLESIIQQYRDTAATLMYQNGEDLLVLKEILGHSNISTTQIYTHMGNTQVRDAMEHSPLAKFKLDEQ